MTPSIFPTEPCDLSNSFSLPTPPPNIHIFSYSHYANPKPSSSCASMNEPLIYFLFSNHQYILIIYIIFSELDVERLLQRPSLTAVNLENNPLSDEVKQMLRNSTLDIKL